MMTKDFTGVYDYERGEAKSEAAYFNEQLVPENTPEENRKDADRIARHWKVVLTPEGYADFADEWNKIVPQFPIYI